ncbi:putative G-protein coupled receptor [Armadillidium vulgare]|nr:putative G-protein coupled receptor [Armadillidium vulgare]
MLVPDLKEEIQKLAAQIEFMKIVHMEMNNRHLKPKPGGYFTEKNVTLVGTGQNATTSLINRKASVPKPKSAKIRRRF